MVAVRTDSIVHIVTTITEKYNMRKDVECPYCGVDIYISHDDYSCEEDEKREQECRECQKVFVYTTTMTTHYDATKADCLNGAPHKYKRTKTYPPEYARMRCTDCGYEIEITTVQTHGE